MKDRHHYARNIGDLKQQLKSAVDVDALRDLHRVRPARHFVVVARLVGLVLLCGWALWQTRWPWLWVPAALLQGFNILGTVILLHEQVHEAIFRRSRPRLNRLLGLLYAMPSGISATQFRTWHLDHHQELGSNRDDPKRAHLSPKKNTRLVKLLYWTPALFLIYARGSRDEAATYPDSEQRIIRRERLGNVAFHLALIAGLLAAGGGWVLRVHVIPLFLMFPMAFSLNRLGQHYDIDPDDPAAWSTLVNGNPLWHFVFLWSNFHLEHHYYPRVPFYNLTALNERLQPFFRERGMRNRTYREILWGWFVLNRKPHSNWRQTR